MGKIKKLILTIDIDNDFMDVPLEGSQELKWTGLLDGLPRVLSSLNDLALSLNKTLSLTIFCRADWQVEKTMGDTAWVFKKTSALLKNNLFSHLKFDLQWHPHLYEFEGNKWKLVSKKGVASEQLQDVHSKLVAEGISVTCSRIGECFFNEEIETSLSALGISVDSTAFPGRNLGHTNWENASFEPGIRKNSGIFEVPFTMIPIKAPYEETEKLRYLNLLFSPQFTQEPISKLKSNNFVTILHPYEVLSLENKNRHQLFGDFDSLQSNVRFLFDKEGVESVFLKDLRGTP